MSKESLIDNPNPILSSSTKRVHPSPQDDVTKTTVTIIDNEEDVQPDEARLQKESDIDINHYIMKTTVAQVLMNLSIILANASFLKILIDQQSYKGNVDFYILLVIIVSISLACQLIVGTLLFIKIRLNINRVTQRKISSKVNDAVTFTIMIITICNIFLAAFSSI
ncbi:ninjurin-1-like [Glandiceps talaboti]